MTFEIRQGHVLEVLRAMPDESVQCCITSPPYYGLRSYGTEPIVWGNHNGCGHVWKTEIKPAANGLINNTMQGETLDGNSATRKPTEYAFCLSCNAWRGELGLEPTFQLYITHLIEIFAEVKRVLKKDGTCWVNLGDSFVGAASETPSSRDNSPIAKGTVKSQERRNGRAERHKAMVAYGLRPKSLMNIPARFAIAMTDELKFIQRNEIVWHKPACMPSSAKDRFTVDFEPIFFFSKNPKYKFNQQLEPQKTEAFEPRLTGHKAWDNDPLMERGKGENSIMKYNPEGRNKRTVWRVNFEPQSSEHYASYPTKLVEPMILAGTDEGDTVMDIFAGTGTTLLTALGHRRNALGIELQPKYIEIAKRRLAEVQVNLF